MKSKVAVNPHLVKAEFAQPLHESSLTQVARDFRSARYRMLGMEADHPEYRMRRAHFNACEARLLNYVAYNWKDE